MSSTRSARVKTSAAPAQKNTQEAAPKSHAIPWYARVGMRKESEYLFENLSTLLLSGMDILQALEGVKNGIRAKRLVQALNEIEEDIEAGKPLWSSLERTRLAPQHITALIRIGEETGRLSENLGMIVDQQQKDHLFRSRVKSAMMYPLMVFVLALVVSMGIAWFILPRLSTVFVSLDVELPLVTRVLIGIGEFISKYGSIVVPSIFAVIVFIGYILFVHPRTKHWGQAMLFTLPGVRTLIQQVELARFGYVLGTLLEAGLPLTHALQSLHDTTTIRRYQMLYDHIRQGVEIGDSFQRCFDSYAKMRRLIPIPIQQMIFAAERSGNLSVSLRHIGETFEVKAETTTKNLSVMIEPILLVIVWGGVVTVAFAVILPVYSLLGQGGF
ncbi:MAG: hypothetical protein A3J66_00455 [Candidatus Magasanikbacteria bacterium RIFCSPHIGHO2_02_FULL_47_14]|uniref:Type II secretion system protein GspF domain-containing protein n=1 Tax=Candidatus Magasanikbacteria bacterium RIFCSPHIGHO2_02_FULL_47_14 TaxID=1798680 RepID=A0A1F6MBA1_9BACT|nr:MAG: hypothetical protein A3J66_00455 [Candidatus Magasanikbacteria bacterium RIFCSPHIGHO2_02_FULL_47_14]